MSNTEGLTKTHTEKVNELITIDEEKRRKFCRLEYPNHPQGCPNYGECDSCPPQAPRVGDWIEVDEKKLFSIAEFDFETYLDRISNQHPEWSIRMKKNPLYWQSSVEKELRNEVKEKIAFEPNYVATLIPEAMGVHVFRTMKKMGYDIKPDPDETVYKVALIGHKVNKSCSNYLKK